MKPVQTSLLYILVSYLGLDRVQCQIAFLPFLFTFFKLYIQSQFVNN